MKKIIIILGVIFVLVLIAGVFKDQLIKSAITTSATHLIGAPVKIGGFSLKVFSRSVRIKDFKIYNPEGFPKGELIDIPQIDVDLDLGALLKKKLHLPLVAIDLKEVSVVKNKQGELNVDALKVAQKKEKPFSKEPEAKKSAEAMPMQIDVLTLSVGKVIYEDYSKGDKPSVQAFEVGLKEKTYKNITSAQQLAALIMVEALGPTTIKGAAIYSAATLLGVGFLPAGVAGVLIGKDSSQLNFNADFQRVFDVSLGVIKNMGTLTQQDAASGVLKGKVDGCNTAIKIKQNQDGSTQVTVSARKYLLPKPEIAGGVLHEISGKLE